MARGLPCNPCRHPFPVSSRLSVEDLRIGFERALRSLICSCDVASDQYLGKLGSTSLIQPRIPPVRFRKGPKPASLSRAIALALADAALAVDDHRRTPVELRQAIRQLGQGMTVEPAIRQIAISSGLRTSRMKGRSPRSSIAFSSSGVIVSFDLAWVSAAGSTTGTPQKLLVVDQSPVIVGLGPADRALQVLADLHLAEAHFEGVVEQEPPGQGPAGPEQQLDGLGRLNDSDQAGQDPQHAPSAQLGTRSGGGGSG